MSLHAIIGAELRRCPGLPIHERRRLERRLAEAIEGAGYRPADAWAAAALGGTPAERRTALSGAQVGLGFPRGAKRVFDWLDRFNAHQRGEIARTAMRATREARDA